MTEPTSTPVVFLPGASGRSAVWRPIADRLAERGPNILVDYPGLGDSPFDPAVGSLTDLYAVVLKALPERCDVVALSMGGVLALRLAIEHPERIRRLVLVATSGGIRMDRFGAVNWRKQWRRSNPSAPSWFVDDQTDLSEQLQSLAAPTLLLFGGADPISPVSAGEFLLARLPNAKLEILPEATHDLVEDYPDLIASFIAAHLDKPDLRKEAYGPSGEASRHLPLGDLHAGLAKLAPSPKDSGRVALLVRRHPDGSRETPRRVHLSREEGLPGDGWYRRPPRDPQAQLAVMRSDVGALIANGQPLTLFGDNLFVDFDISAANLPTGSRLQVGEAVVEVTPKPHNGCLKFKERFGPDALGLVQAGATRDQNLRGIYWKVIENGEVEVGAPIRVLLRKTNA